MGTNLTLVRMGGDMSHQSQITPIIVSNHETLLFTTKNKFPNCFVELYIVIVFDVCFQLAMGDLLFLKCLQNSPHWEKL